MATIKFIWFFLFTFFFTFASLIPLFTAQNDIDDIDETSNDLQMSGSEEAEESMMIMDSEHHITNDTRRELKGRKKRGPCLPTNLIDKCWRCNPKWAENRHTLASCAFGFGNKATGGKGGKIYKVTSNSDDDLTNPRPGTLRHAVIQTEPLWIIFKSSMYIVLKQELIMTSHKTIDGRGASVTIHKGAGITIQNIRNIIIHNIHIRDIIPTEGGMIRDSLTHSGLRTHDDGDGISIFAAKDIWLDHLSMSNCSDGLIDAIEGSTGITISNCHFTDQDKAMLFGGRDYNPIDKVMQITLAYNHFGKRMMQRMPRCRSGFFHIVNNDYTHWNMYAIGGSSAPTIISQGNRFIAQGHLKIGEEYKKEITHRDTSIPVWQWMKWTWVSDGDIFQNGAHFTASGDPNGAKIYAALELIKPLPAEKVGELTKDTGYLPCRRDRPC